MKLLTFKVNEAQEKELQALMEHEGYTNKTEFFRYLMKFYKIHQGLNINQPISQQIGQKSVPDNRHQGLTNAANNATGDENLSERKRKLLADPNIWDEGVRQLIRDMPD